MNKKHEQVSFPLGSTIDEVVNELLSYREKGELAVGKFNGVTLYSDTVTLDSAYREITGKTKKEMDKKEIESFLDTAISEINYALKSHKSKEVKEFYLENAIRFINRAKEKLGENDG